MAPDELARLIDERAAALVLYARQWCAAPEDVVQEAFVKLMAQGSPPEQPVPWLFRVVRNAAISARRAAERRRRHETVAAQRQRRWFEFAGDTALDADAVTRALQSLPSDQREIITLHLWGGLTFAQIADVIGCSSSSAHRWYEEGLARLRERLDVPCTRI